MSETQLAPDGGPPLHGNYRHYYKVRYRYGHEDGMQASSDPRVVYLKKQLPVGARILDIGCNSGLLSTHIAATCRARSLVGIDIDEALIAHASLRSQDPEEMARTISLDGDDSGPDVVYPFFPAPLERQYGPVDREKLAAVVAKEKARALKKPKISFRCEDFVAEEELPESERGAYDVVLLLAVTKWVHINGGDEAVNRLFRKAAAALAPNGILVLEAQPWSSYRTKKMRSWFAKERFGALRMRPDHFHDALLGAHGFVDFKRASLPGVGRAMVLYYKRKSDEGAKRRKVDEDE